MERRGISTALLKLLTESKPLFGSSRVALMSARADRLVYIFMAFGRAFDELRSCWLELCRLMTPHNFEDDGDT